MIVQQCPQRREKRELGHLLSLYRGRSQMPNINRNGWMPHGNSHTGVVHRWRFDLFYYTHHIGDYLSHTAHLSILEHGVYMRLLQVYYLNEKPLIATEAPRQIGARSPEELDAVQRVLSEFFIETPQGLANKRSEEEIQKYYNKSQKARESANARWSNDMRTHSERNAKAMLTNNHKPKTITHTSMVTNPILDTSISNIVEEDANALQTHSERIATVSPPHSPPITSLLPVQDQGKAWAYKLKEREEAGEELTISQRNNWRQALKVRT